MPETIFGSVFSAQPHALTAALDREPVRSTMAQASKQRLFALVQSVLPDVLETPLRVKRLNNALGEWLSHEPRTWSDVEMARQEFHDIIDDYVQSVHRVLEVVRELGFGADDIAALERCQQDLRDLQTSVFSTWEPFTAADLQAAQTEIRQGKVHDLDTLIRELQGSHH